MSARVLEVTPEEYLADPCASPSLSASLAHTLVERSPRHAWLEHPRLGAERRGDRKTSSAMDEGSILHRLILGKGAQFELVPAPDWRTGWGRQVRDEVRAAGKLPVLTHEFERLAKIADRVRRRCVEEGFPLDGRSELPIEFTEQGERGEVLCRCMVDHVREAVSTILDVKRLASANPRDLERKIVEYGYDIQRAAYVRAVEQLEPDLEGRVDFVFICFEPEAPFEVVPVRLNGAFREIGERRWRHAVRLWEELLNCGSYPWPGYADGAVTLEPPHWVLTQYMPGETWE